MNQGIWNKRIPTLLGIILIGVGIAVTTFLVNQGGFISTKASPSQTPKNVRVSNITDTSLTVSYITDDQSTGVVSYGDTPSFGQSALDDRDQQSGNVTEHKLHYMTLHNLAPSTKYYFSIISGKDTYTNNGSPYEATTGQKITDNPLSQDPMSGKIILPNGSTPMESAIYMTTSGAQVVSTLVKSDGTFIIPLNSLRDEGLSKYFALNQDTIIKLLATGDGLSSNITLSANQINPIPTITLSSDYDFTSDQTPVPTSPASQETFPVFNNGSNSSAEKNPTISSPQKDQGFTDQQPQFKGTAPANEDVQVIIHSDEQIKTTVKSDANGNWNYRPSSNLSPGNHTITIIAKDASGIVKTITQSFVVYASGNQIAGDQGSPTPSPSISPSPSITPTPTPTQGVATPTQEPTSAPNTPTPTTLVLLSPSPTGTLPATGNPTIITAGIIGLVISLMGGVIFLLARGSIL